MVNAGFRQLGQLFAGQFARFGQPIRFALSSPLVMKADRLERRVPDREAAGIGLFGFRPVAMLPLDFGVVDLAEDPVVRGSLARSTPLNPYSNLTSSPGQKLSGL